MIIISDALPVALMPTIWNKSNEEWSSQLWSQFLQLRKEAWKKIQDFNWAWTRDPRDTGATLLVFF